MLLNLKHRRATRLQLVAAQPLALVASPSLRLETRPQDDGPVWPALASRCCLALPANLEWAAPLLDENHPLPVLCAEGQARELLRWLDARPNTERASIGCQRGRTGTGHRPRP